MRATNCGNAPEAFSVEHRQIRRRCLLRTSTDYTARSLCTVGLHPGLLCDSGKPAKDDQSLWLRSSPWPVQGGSCMRLYNDLHISSGDFISSKVLVAFGRCINNSPHCVVLRGLDMAAQAVSAGVLVTSSDKSSGTLKDFDQEDSARRESNATGSSRGPCPGLAVDMLCLQPPGSVKKSRPRGILVHRSERSRFQSRGPASSFLKIAAS